MAQKKQDASILPIVQQPNKVLRKKAAPIYLGDIKNARIQKLIAAMRSTLAHTENGVGLAAPQVGESLRIFLASEEAEEIDNREHLNKSRQEIGADEKKLREWRYYVYINPVIKKISRRSLDDAEGCLSVKDKFGMVKRAEKITVEAYDEHGIKFIRGASRFFARVLQHELDHLEGVLFIDKAELLEPIPHRAAHVTPTDPLRQSNHEASRQATSQ